MSLLSRRAPELRDDPRTTQLLGALAAARTELEAATVVRADYRDALRMRLLAVAAVTEPAAARPAPAPRPLAAAVSWTTAVRLPRRAAVCAASLVGVVALTGVGVAATRSLPGEPLYGAKRATEALQLATAGGDLDTGVAHLHLAETRLREVRALAQGRGALALPSGTSDSVLAGGGRAEQVRRALADMDAQTRSGGRLVVSAAQATGDDAPLALLQQWSGEQAARLRDVVPVLPEAARDRADASLSLVAGLGAGAGALRDGAAPGSPLPGGTVAPGSPGTPVVPGAPVDPARPGSSVPGGSGGSSGPGGAAFGATVPGTAPSITGSSPGTAPLPGLPVPTLPPLPSLPVPRAPGPSLPVPSLPVLSLPAAGAP